MSQREIYVEVAKSQKRISAATVFGAIFADPKKGRVNKSKKAVESWLFNTDARTYKRKRIVWECQECAGKVRRGEQSASLGVGLVLLLAAIIGVVLFFVLS